MTYLPGDLIFFQSKSDHMSRLIWWSQLLTMQNPFKVKPTHVGIMAYVNDTPLLFESTTLCRHPCIITGKHIDGIQAHPVEERIADYPSSPITLRLHKECQFTKNESIKLTTLLLNRIGQRYDPITAALSVTWFLKRCLDPQLNTLFCSALCARTLQCMNRMNWQNPELLSPALLYHTLINTGVYYVVPNPDHNPSDPLEWATP